MESWLKDTIWGIKAVFVIALIFGTIGAVLLSVGWFVDWGFSNGSSELFVLGAVFGFILGVLLTLIVMGEK